MTDDEYEIVSNLTRIRDITSILRCITSHGPIGEMEYHEMLGQLTRWREALEKEIDPDNAPY